jgi:hypothetical protein
VTRVSHPIDRVEVTFDEPNLVANAGLVLVGTLAVRLELEKLVNAMVRLVGRVGGARPGRKVLTLVHAMVAGASHIDHAEVLRSGGTERVLPHRVMAPSTLRTFPPLAGACLAYPRCSVSSSSNAVSSTVLVNCLNKPPGPVNDKPCSLA